MQQVEEYRRLADECFLLAQQALPEHRPRILALCAMWKKLAEQRLDHLRRNQTNNGGLKPRPT